MKALRAALAACFFLGASPAAPQVETILFPASREIQRLQRPKTWLMYNGAGELIGWVITHETGSFVIHRKADRNDPKPR